MLAWPSEICPGVIPRNAIAAVLPPTVTCEACQGLDKDVDPPALPWERNYRGLPVAKYTTMYLFGVTGLAVVLSVKDPSSPRFCATARVPL